MAMEVVAMGLVRDAKSQGVAGMTSGEVGE
jgi:hypothetical protein